VLTERVECLSQNSYVLNYGRLIMLLAFELLLQVSNSIMHVYLGVFALASTAFTLTLVDCLTHNTVTY